MRKAICYVLAALMCAGVALYGLTTPVAASSQVTITIETTLRHHTSRPRAQTFTYRVRWQTGVDGFEDVEVAVARDGAVWRGSTTQTITLPSAGTSMTVTPLRVGNYDTSPSSRRVSGNATISFTHRPRATQDDDYDDWQDWDWLWWDDDDDWYDYWDDRDDSWLWCERDNRCRTAACWYCGDEWRAYRGGPARPVAIPVPTSAVNAMESAARIATGNRAVVTERDRTSISPLRLRSLHQAAQRHGRTAVLHADTLTADMMAVQGRLVVEPGRLGERTTDLLLGVYTAPAQTQAVQQMFHRTFTNRVAVVRLAHQGELGARMQVAARVDLSGLATGNLHFFSYERTTGRTVALPNPEHRIDSNGYLVFNTGVGGYIIVTDRPLTRR